jgi:toxin CptA
LHDASIVLRASSWLMVVCMVLLAGRLTTHCIAVIRARAAPLRYIWSPHVATTVMGLAFLVAFVTLGSWTYTDTLLALARGNMVDVVPKLLLACALLAGAILASWTGGMFKSARPSVRRVARCLTGGALMGAGASMIPGGSDGLILVGMPLLWLYAWLGFASMCATIYVACRLTRGTWENEPRMPTMTQ